MATKSTKRNSRPQSILARIRGLKINETVTFPIENIDTVRCQASKCNLVYGGRRTTHTDKTTREIHVTRIE